MEHPRCNKMSQVMKIEIDLIKKHLNKHKEYNHILSDDDAIIDFVNKFAWVMREAICAVCNNKECKIRIPEEKFDMGNITDTIISVMIDKCESDKELSKIEFSIIKKHIKDHKWYNHIPTYSAAVADFLSKYGWIIKELREARSKIS